jgi:hypothetical protein
MRRGRALQAQEFRLLVGRKGAIAYFGMIVPR